MNFAPRLAKAGVPAVKEDSVDFVAPHRRLVATAQNATLVAHATRTAAPQRADPLLLSQGPSATSAPVCRAPLRVSIWTAAAPGTGRSSAAVKNKTCQTAMKFTFR